MHNCRKIKAIHPVQSKDTQASAAPASDPEAQARAAAAAEQRQQKFDQSAGGRAVRKAVAAVLRDKQAGRPDNHCEQMAKDWLS